jgi:RimJ/RimL family protein N-acetyltransferase
VTAIQTGRLTLRRFRPDDLATIHRWHSDERFVRHLTGRPITLEESEATLRRWFDHWDAHGFGLYAVEWSESGELIGRAGPQFHRFWPGNPEVGWALDPEWWGRGIATEAGAAAVAFGFELGYTRLVSITVEQNVASRAVMAKLGFELLERIPFDHEALAGELWVHALDRQTVTRS